MFKECAITSKKPFHHSVPLPPQFLSLLTSHLLSLSRLEEPVGLDILRELVVSTFREGPEVDVPGLRAVGLVVHPDCEMLAPIRYDDIKIDLLRRVRELSKSSVHPTVWPTLMLWQAPVSSCTKVNGEGGAMIVAGLLQPLSV